MVGLIVGLVLMWLADRNLYNTRLIFPFFKQLIPDLGWFYVPFAAFVLVAWSNAVNLTDGLDGLAISTFAVAAACFTALAYITGHRVFAEYLLLVRFAPAGELTIFCGALVGASLGFLWYNAHPAEIFMGDVGSLALGGAIATVAILIKQELLLVIVGGVFVIEAASVVIQVASFKLRGKRVFKMAPLHHHFELSGWEEPKVITRFLIVAILFALFSLTTLKLQMTTPTFLRERAAGAGRGRCEKRCGRGAPARAARRQRHADRPARPSIPEAAGPAGRRRSPGTGRPHAGVVRDRAAWS